MLESDLDGLLKWLYRLWPSMVVVALAIGFGSFLIVRRLRSRSQRIGTVFATLILGLPLVVLVPLLLWNTQTYPAGAVHVWNRSLSVVSLDSRAGEHIEVDPCSTATVSMDVERVQVKVGANYAFTFGDGSPGARYVYAHGRQAWGNKPPDPLPPCA
jgi:hypothetical protein